MTARKSNTRARLRKIKRRYQRQIRQLKQEVEAQLTNIEQHLHPLLYSQSFYNEAMMNLLTSENEPDSDILIGAMVTQRWLRQEGNQLSKQLAKVKQQLQKR